MLEGMQNADYVVCPPTVTGTDVSKDPGNPQWTISGPCCVRAAKDGLLGVCGRGGEKVKSAPHLQNPLVSILGQHLEHRRR